MANVHPYFSDDNIDFYHACGNHCGMPLPFTTFKLSIRNNSRGKNAIPILIVLVELDQLFYVCLGMYENYVGYNIGSSYVLSYRNKKR